MADQVPMSRVTEDIADDNWGPFVFRRAPRTPVVDYDNDEDNVLETAREDLHARLMEGAPRPRPTMQKTSAKAVPKRRQAIIAQAEEVEEMVEAIENTMRKERICKRSAEQDRKAHGEKAFIAQMAARFAEEERELTRQQDFYQRRDPSEDPLPPLATSMEDLGQRDAHIEARRRCVTAHEYRNSLVTSTTTPNVDNPSKSSLDSPIIEVAIDQFLTQDSEKIETLHQKLGKLCGIAMERAEKLGLVGVTEDDIYLLKHIRASKRTQTEPSWTEDSADDVPAVTYQDKESVSKAEGKRHVMECADAASAQCQRHSYQPIQSRSRRSSMFSGSTSYVPFSSEPEVPAVDKVKSEELSSGQIPGYRDRSLAECVYMNVAYFDLGDPLKLLLKPIARAVYDLDSLPQRMSDDEFEQACVNEFHKMGEYDHWKLQNTINQTLQDTAPDRALQRHCVQELRARVYDARNPKRSSDEGNNEFSEETVKQEGKASLEQLQEDIIAQAAKKAEPTTKDPHDDLDKRGTPKGRISSKYAKNLARNSLRAKKLMCRKKAKQPTVSDAADTYESLQTEKEDTSDSSSTWSSSSSDPSNVVKSSNGMTERQRRECSLDAPTVDRPWMGLTLPPPHSSSDVCRDVHYSEVEAVLFAGCSPRSPIHSGGGDDEHVRH
ncbi:hypothetical protein E2P81_ATG02839 [Venturia nashicola]|nr:hypothetical protein E2P81_ATG02839 [Venturia nashicola]